MSALPEIDEVHLEKGKTKSKLPKARTSAKKGGQAKGKGVDRPSGRLSKKQVVESVDEDSAIKTAQEKSLVPSSIIAHDEYRTLPPIAQEAIVVADTSTKSSNSQFGSSVRLQNAPPNLKLTWSKILRSRNPCAWKRPPN